MNLVDGRIVDGGIAIGGTTVPLERPGRPVGTRVTAGVRPESLDLVADGHGIPAVVNVVEELGAEAYVYAYLAEHFDTAGVTAASDLIARVEPHNAPAMGERISLRVKSGALLLFDADSGERIPAAG
jgi:multiple sugar transport system ATP-binding protein